MGSVAEPIPTNPEPEITHFYHDCDPSIALCGRNVASLEEDSEITSSTPGCPECVELLDEPCDRCGMKILVDA